VVASAFEGSSSFSAVITELVSSLFTFNVETGLFFTASSSSSASNCLLCSLSLADSASVIENRDTRIEGLGQAVETGREKAVKSGSSAMVAATEDARSSSSEPIVNASASA
jgi:citrate lyase synthetase